MATVIYSATMSLDGYIAGPGGDMSWLARHLGDPDPAAEHLLARTGCLLVGGRTFRGDDPHRGTESEGAFEGRYAGPSVVLTRHPPQDAVPETLFASDLRAAVATATELAGAGYVNVLGAEVARECLSAGLLDEVLVFVAPVLLGDGTPLFVHPGGTEVLLGPVEDRAVQDAVARSAQAHWYRVLKNGPTDDS